MKNLIYLNRKLLVVTQQHKKLEQKKELCVNAQLEFENNFLSLTLSFNRKYQKLIELDFELAEKIKDISKQIKNLKLQIFRAETRALLCN